MNKRQVIFIAVALVILGGLLLTYRFSDPYGWQSKDSEEEGASDYLEISEWGVKAPLYAGYPTLKYSLSTDKSAAYFTSQELEDKNISTCGDNSGGTIIRYKSTDKTYDPVGEDTGFTPEEASEKGNHPNWSRVGDYYFQYISPQDVCSDIEAVEELHIKTSDAVARFTKELKTSQ